MDFKKFYERVELLLRIHGSQYNINVKSLKISNLYVIFTIYGWNEKTPVNIPHFQVGQPLSYEEKIRVALKITEQNLHHYKPIGKVICLIVPSENEDEGVRMIDFYQGETKTQSYPFHLTGDIDLIEDYLPGYFQAFNNPQK